MNMTFWKTFWASLIATVSAGILLLIIFFLIVSAMVSSAESMFSASKLTVKENTVLHMELNGTIGDYTYADFSPTSFQLEKQFGLKEVLSGIEIAKADENIKGIFLNCDNVSAGLATVQEIRAALEDFQESGKFIVAYHENYSSKAYYLSSVAKELYVFPSGMIDFLGLGAELMFFKGALEKLEVDVQIIRGSNNKFKSAVEPFINEKMSDANREQVQKYLDALWGEMTKAVGASRNLKEGYLNKVADSVLIRKSSDAVTYKMADAVKYYDEVLQNLAEKVEVDEDSLQLLSFQKYALKKTKEAHTLTKLDDKNIAVIFAEGEIVDGRGDKNQIGGTRLSEQIREARIDDKIKAVVLRVNSPGGSALASDIIWREVQETKKLKPVIVSMGDLAASGGYYIACEANRIFAQPTTITGSIGVFGMIPYTGDLFKNKMGITFDRVQTNAHSVISLNKRLEEDELAIIQEGVDDIYDDFISKVAKGRNMTKAAVDSIGQGRVWAGKDAIELGLVDEFGGLHDAIAYAADEAGIAEDKVAIKYIPLGEENQFFQFLENLEEGQGMQAREMTPLESQLKGVYQAIRGLSKASTYQARMPYMLWVE